MRQWRLRADLADSWVVTLKAARARSRIDPQPPPSPNICGDDIEGFIECSCAEREDNPPNDINQQTCGKGHFLPFAALHLRFADGRFCPNPAFTDSLLRGALSDCNQKIHPMQRRAYPFHFAHSFRAYGGKEPFVRTPNPLSRSWNH